jgi:hypothetical protein
VKRNRESTVKRVAFLGQWDAPKILMQLAPSHAPNARYGESVPPRTTAVGRWRAKRKAAGSKRKNLLTPRPPRGLHGRRAGVDVPQLRQPPAPSETGCGKLLKRACCVRIRSLPVVASGGDKCHELEASRKRDVRKSGADFRCPHATPVDACTASLGRRWPRSHEQNGVLVLAEPAKLWTMRPVHLPA